MSKSKMLDIGSNMSFRNRDRAEYSMENIKEMVKPGDKVVKIDIEKLEFAPQEWNFYPPLDEEEFEKLINSILEHGLLHPIVVRKDHDKHIILSGHNRVRAYKTIGEEIRRLQRGEGGSYFTLENQDIISSEYEQIMAVIKEDITDYEAQEIIIDANYVQRQLSQKLVTRSVIEKYKIIQEKRKVDSDGAYKSIKTREIVARDFNLSGRHIDRYKRLERLHEEILQLFYEGKISLELASKIAGLDGGLQKHLVEYYLKDLPKCSAKMAGQIKQELTVKDLDELFQEQALPQNQITLKIRQQGKTSKIVIDDEETMERILSIL